MIIFKKLVRISWTGLLAAVLIPVMSHAQGIHTTSSSMALGGGGGAYVKGYHANFINPANLMLPDRDKQITIGVLGGIRSSAGGGLVNMSLYNDHFTNGRIIDRQVTLGIADDWFGSGSSDNKYMGADVAFVPVGVSIRKDTYAFSSAVRVRSMVSAHTNKGFFNLVLAGLDPAVFGEEKNVNMGGEFVAFTEWSFGYARQVWGNQDSFEPGSRRVFAGIAPKLLFGFGYAEMKARSSLQVTGGEDAQIIHDFEYKLHSIGAFTEELEAYYFDRRLQHNQDASISDYLDEPFSDLGRIQGFGLGFDLGATYEWYMRDVDIPVVGSGPQILRVSFSVTDLGHIRFADNAETYRASDVLEWEGLSVDFGYINEEYDEFSDYFGFVMEDSLGSDVYGNFHPEEVSSHRVGMNPVVNVGSALSMGKLDVLMDMGKGFNNRGVNSRRMYVALGSEYRLLNVIPVRTGIRIGGYSSLNWSFGTGVSLPSFDFSVGVMTTPSSRKSGANYAAAWSGFVIRF